MEKQKPLCLTLDEARTEIFSGVVETSRKHGLPAYLLLDILSELHNQVAREKQQELMTARKDYEAAQSEGKDENTHD